MLYHCDDVRIAAAAATDCLTCPTPGEGTCRDCSIAEHFEATPAALRFRGAHNVSFRNCTFRHLGSNALSFAHGSHANTVSHSHFYDLSASAVAIGNRTTPLRPEYRDWDADNRLSDCHIHHVATEYRGAPAVLVGFSRATSVLHNDIHHIP